MNHPISEVTRRYLNRYEQILGGLESGMKDAGLTDSISHNFIVQMIPHHRAAIEMSRNVLKYIHSPALRTIAQGIITEQTKSIANMEAALPGCSDLKNDPEAVSRYQARTSEIMDEMFQKMRNALKTNRIAEDFMLEMIPHHEGAIQMSENALKYPVCDRLKPILDAIITSQERGMEQMKALLQLDEKP